MSSRLQNLTVWIGDTTELAVMVTHGGVAYDLTGKTFLWYVATPAAPTVALVAKTVSSHTDPAAGKSAVTLTAGDLASCGGAGSYLLTGVIQEGTAQRTRLQVNLLVESRPV